jgi:cytidylate kinase
VGLKRTQRTVITVDGLAASGKSTLARDLAHQLWYVHLNTGLAYRGVAYLARKEGVSLENPRALAKLVHKLEYRLPGGEQLPLQVEDRPRFEAKLYCGKEDLTDKLHTNVISALTSKVAQIPEVREAVTAFLRSVFPGRNIVAEGRDAGSNIYKDEAKLIIWLEASVEKRAGRALERRKGSGTMSDDEYAREFARMREFIMDRDRRDQSRAVNPAQAPPNAVVLNGDPAKELVLASALEECHKHGIEADIPESLKVNGQPRAK